MRKPGIVLIAVFLCNTNISAQSHAGSNALPHVLVYKTKAGYRNLVPVELSADKKKVVSYPAPADLETGSGHPLPVLLHKGYQLDKRGIGVNSAFIKLTYEQYSKLKEVPSPDELYKMIVDKNPMTALYDCGARGGSTSVKQLNALIDKKELGKKCKALR